MTGILVLGSYANRATADDIVMASGDWCPYVCDPAIHEGKHGYLVDVAKIVFEAAGHSFDMRYMPFARAIKYAREGINNGIPGVYRGDVPDFIFPAISQGQGINTFYVKKETSWIFENKDSLNKLERLGVIREYYYGDEISEFISRFPEKVNVLYGHDCQRRALQQLRIGRITAWLEDNHVAQYNIMRTGLNDEIIPSGRIGGELPVYIAFSPTNAKSDTYARLIVDGVEKLRQNGNLHNILSVYGMKDWVDENNR